MKLYRIILLSFLSTQLIFKVFGTFHDINDVTSGNCEEYPIDPKEVIALYNWPYAFSCRSIIEKELYHYYEENENLLANCQVWSTNGSLLHNETYRLSDFYDAEEFVLLELKEGYTSFILILSIINQTACRFQNITLNAIYHQPQTCQEFVRSQTDAVNKWHIGDERKIRCNVRNEDYPKLPGRHTLYTYEWRQDCSRVLKNGRSRELKLSPLKRSDAGTFVCSVTYNGMTRFIRREVNCLKGENPRKNVKWEVVCKEETLYKLVGESAQFSCKSDFETGEPSTQDIKVLWRKLDGKETNKILCNARKPERFEKGKVYCYFDSNQRCSTDPQYRPSSNASVIPFFIHFENVTESDYGVYEIDVSFLNQRSRPTFNLTLERNTIPHSLESMKIAWIITSAFVASVILSLLTLWTFLYLKVFYKRYFAAYTTDDKKFGVYIAYHFSKDLDRFAQSAVKNSIQLIRELLEKMGFSVHDAKKEYSTESRAKSIEESIGNCHRVVILLSAEFIKDDWSLLVLQKGFNETVNSGTKIIFVLLPGVKEFLKQHSKTDITHAAIRRALKANYVIQIRNSQKISRTFKSRKFAFQLEDAMPKLRKSPMQRLASVSSDDISLHCEENAQLNTQISATTTLSAKTNSELHVL